MWVQAALQGREAEQTQVFMLSAQHCQLRAWSFFVFSYPTLCLQPAQPDELSCLGHLDRTIHITTHLPPRPPCPPTNSNGESKASEVQPPPVFSTPQNHSRIATFAPLFSSELGTGTSLAQGTCSIWHVSPTPAQAPHMLSCYQPLG